MTPLMDAPPNFMAYQMAETPVSHAVDIEGLRRQHSHVASPQTLSVAGSPQVEALELPSDRAGAPIKQLSELDMELSRLIPKGGQQPQQQGQQNGPAGVLQQIQKQSYSEVLRQHSITVTTNEPQNLSITTTGDEVSSTKGNEETQALVPPPQHPPPMVRKVSRFQVSTVVEQQQMQQLQQQQSQMEEKTVLITQNQSTPTTTSTATMQQKPDSNIIYQQQKSKGKERK